LQVKSELKTNDYLTVKLDTFGYVHRRGKEGGPPGEFWPPRAPFPPPPPPPEICILIHFGERLYSGQISPPNPAKTFLFSFFGERLYSRQINAPNPAKTFILFIYFFFWTKKRSKSSDDVYFAFPILALSVLPPCPKIVTAPLDMWLVYSLTLRM